MTPSDSENLAPHIRLRTLREFLGYSVELAAHCLATDEATLLAAEAGDDDLARLFISEMEQW